MKVCIPNMRALYRKQANEGLFSKGIDAFKKITRTFIEQIEVIKKRSCGHDKLFVESQSLISKYGGDLT